MNRRIAAALLITIALLLTGSLSAHVGSPDVFLDGHARLTPLHLTSAGLSIPTPTQQGSA